jgi:dolichyl-phosphate beta-glucosyltransferase
MTKKKIELVVPCFNEENRFPTDYWIEIIKLQPEIKWTFINDGSTDSTGAILDDISQKTSARVIHLDSNLGKGNAIRTGLVNVIAKDPSITFCGFVDADGAFSADDIESMRCEAFQRLGQHDVIISSRVALAGRNISRKISRHYLGRIIATFITYKWENAPYDTQSGFKIFLKTQYFEKAISKQFQTRWFSDVELITRIGFQKHGDLSIWEFPLNTWKDVNESKIRLKNSPSILKEIFIARRQVKSLIRKRIE